MTDKQTCPLVSLIIPVYNVEKYLKKCLDSVVNQTYENIEIIIVNDGSTDKSAEVIEFFLFNTKIKHFLKENCGLMSAWIYGVIRSSGDYLVFIDSDDWLELDAVELLVNEIVNNDVDIVAANFENNYENGNSIKINHNIKDGNYYRDEYKDQIFPYLFYNKKYRDRGIYLTRWAKIFKRELIVENLKHCNNDLTIGEDVNILFPSILESKGMRILNNKFIYHYRQTNYSMMRKYDKNMLKKISLLKDELLRISRVFNEYDFDNAIINDFTSLFLLHIKRILIFENLSNKMIKFKIFDSANDNGLIYRSIKEFKGIDKFLLINLKLQNYFVFKLFNIYYRKNRINDESF
jgi:glycosyltransferase involved in cell wall biosynthesis